MNSKRKVRCVTALVAVALLLAACGNDDDSSSASMATEAPTDAVQPTVVSTPAATEAPEPTEPPEEQAEIAPVVLGGDPPLPRGEDSDPAVGQPVPSLSGTAIDGTPFEWTPGTSPTVIVFLAHWCPACQGEIAELTEWLDEGNRLPEGVAFFGVSTLVNPERDNYPPSQWLADEGWPFPVLLDDAESTVSTAFGLSGTPFWALVSADGLLVNRGSGRIPPDDLVGLFDQLLADAEG